MASFILLVSACTGLVETPESPESGNPGGAGGNPDAGTSGTGGAGGTGEDMAGGTGSTAGKKDGGIGGTGGKKVDAGAGGAGGGIPSTVTFRELVPVFNKSCGAAEDVNSGCHGKRFFVHERCTGPLSMIDDTLGSKNMDGTSTGCLDLTLYERLIKLPTYWSQCSPEMQFVAPGSLEDSYLYQAISGNPGVNGRCMDVNDGSANPPPRMPVPPLRALDEATINKFRDWILAGAPDN